MNKGFTLVELIAVVTILALLAVITTPAYESISSSVKKRNYESKMESIKAQTLSYVEKYLKDKVYDGSSTQKNPTYSISHAYCFSPNFLIQNGIINSDDEKDDYIKSDVTDKKYSGNNDLSGNNTYIKVFYDYKALKLKAVVVDQKVEVTNSSNKVVKIDFSTVSCNGIK